MYFLFELFASDLDSMQPSLKRGKLKALGDKGSYLRCDKDRHELEKSAKRGTSNWGFASPGPSSNSLDHILDLISGSFLRVVVINTTIIPRKLQ